MENQQLQRISTRPRNTLDISYKMKFTHLAAILALVAPAVMAMPADEGGDLVMRESPDLVMDLEARACGAAGSCKGINKNRLCKDRVSIPRKF